jgi:hypothetical protein
MLKSQNQGLIQSARRIGKLVLLLVLSSWFLILLFYSDDVPLFSGISVIHNFSGLKKIDCLRYNSKWNLKPLSDSMSCAIITFFYTEKVY